MKNVLTLLSVMTFVNVMNAQIDLKAYVESSYYKSESMNVLDSFSTTSKNQSYWLQPSIALAFNTRKKNFHQFSFRGLTFQKTEEERNLPSSGFKQRIFNLDLQYGYFYTFLKESKRWNPFVSIQSTFQMSRYKIINSQNDISKTLRLSGNVNSSVGTQFMFNDKIGLELSSTVTFIDFATFRISRKSQNVNNPTIDYYGNITRRTNEVLLKNIPIKLGLVVRI
jgi:hypothetical protein